MRVLVLQGSPRRNGNTATLAGSLLEGPRNASPMAEISEFWLNDLHIRPCQGCFRCAKTQRCILDDDMQRLYPEFEAANAVVFAVPIYWWHMNAQTKLCIDRLTALLSPDDKLPALAGKPIVLVVSFNFCDCARATIGMVEDFKAWIGITLDVVEHCAGDGHVAAAPEKLRAAYELGRRWQRGNRPASSELPGCSAIGASSPHSSAC